MRCRVLCSPAAVPCLCAAHFITFRPESLNSSSVPVWLFPSLIAWFLVFVKQRLCLDPVAFTQPLSGDAEEKGRGESGLNDVTGIQSVCFLELRGKFKEAWPSSLNPISVLS